MYANKKKTETKESRENVVKWSQSAAYGHRSVCNVQCPSSISPHQRLLYLQPFGRTFDIKLCKVEFCPPPPPQINFPGAHLQHESGVNQNADAHDTIRLLYIPKSYLAPFKHNTQK